MSLAGVREALKSKEEARNSRQRSSSSNRTWLKLKNGDKVRVRFLEEDDDFKTAWTHTVEKHGTRQDGSSYTYYEERLANGPNDLNERGEKPRFKFWVNVIWRDGPVFDRDEEGKIIRQGREPVVVDQADVLAIFSGGITIAEDLDYLNGKYKGLTSRDWLISRTGSTKDDTKYTIEPVGEEDDEGNVTYKRQPMSAQDKKLAQDKYDIDELIDELRTNAENYRPYNSNSETEPRPIEERENVFKRTRKFSD